MYLDFHLLQPIQHRSGQLRGQPRQDALGSLQMTSCKFLSGSMRSNPNAVNSRVVSCSSAASYSTYGGLLFG